MNKRIYLFAAAALALASISYYYYKRTLAFKPTQQTAKLKVEVVFNP